MVFVTGGFLSWISINIASITAYRARLGLAWLGLDWLGLDWIGLDWIEGVQAKC